MYVCIFNIIIVLSNYDEEEENLSSCERAEKKSTTEKNVGRVARWYIFKLEIQSWVIF
jgi:hypothetical protein